MNQSNNPNQQLLEEALKIVGQLRNDEAIRVSEAKITELKERALKGDQRTGDYNVNTQQLENYKTCEALLQGLEITDVKRGDIPQSKDHDKQVLKDITQLVLRERMEAERKANVRKLNGLTANTKKVERYKACEEFVQALQSGFIKQLPIQEDSNGKEPKHTKVIVNNPFNEGEQTEITGFLKAIAFDGGLDDFKYDFADAVCTINDAFIGVKIKKSKKDELVRAIDFFRFLHERLERNN